MIKLALGTAIVLLILALVEPLAVFFIECLRNPEALKVELSEVLQINSTHSLVSTYIKYSGRVVLKNFKIYMAGEEVEFGEVVAGEYRREIVVPVSLLRESGGYDIEFSIAGIYKLREVVRSRL